MQTIEILLQNRIAPRIQVFINKNNISQLPDIQSLIETLDLERKCIGFDKEFAFFLHQGSCGGENEQFYDVWITPEDIEKIPQKLIDFSLKHWEESSINKVLGKPEKELYNELIKDNSTGNIVTNSPVLFIDKDFNVYPNYEAPSQAWCLGNLKADKAEKILYNYVNNISAAQHILRTIPISEMVKKCGNAESMRLFGKWDYRNFILSKYCRTV